VPAQPGAPQADPAVAGLDSVPSHPGTGADPGEAAAGEAARRCPDQAVQRDQRHPRRVGPAHARGDGRRPARPEGPREPEPWLHARQDRGVAGGATGCKRGHKWTYHVELPTNTNGARHQVTTGGFTTGKEAADARADVLRLHREGQLPAGGKLTVAEWLRSWLITQEEVRGLRDGTLIDYRRHVESYWIPYIGAVKLVDLRTRQVTEALAAIKRRRDKDIARAVALNDKYAAEAEADNARRCVKGFKRMAKPRRVPVPRPFGPATAQRVHATLRAALNAAIRAEEVFRNVAVHAERPRVTRAKVKPWEPDQLGTWLDTIAEQRLYPLFHLAAFAGLRRGELCGLGWDDLNLNTGRLTVWWQITGVGYRKARAAERAGQPGVYRTRLKTVDGEARLVDLDNATVAVLKTWRKQQITERLAWGPAWDNPDNLIFTRENGRPLDPGAVYKTFIRLVEQAGWQPKPLHHLRHGSASLQLAAGVDIAVVSKRLGHSKIDLTSDTYGHLIGTAGKQAAEAAAALVPRHTR